MASDNSTFSFLLLIIFLLAVQVCSAVQLAHKKEDDPLRSPPILFFRPKSSSPDFAMGFSFLSHVSNNIYSLL